MHPRTQAKTKEVVKTILELIATGLMTWAVLGSPKSLGKYERVLGSTNSFSSWRIHEALKRLKMQNMIQYDENDIKSPIRLTAKGMVRLTRYKFKDFFKRHKKWDHFWRLVVFDVPEKHRHRRQQLRQELINLGFYPFQKSVLVCPFDCERVIRDLCETYRVSKYVFFCITPSLGSREDEVREFFFARSKKQSEDPNIS